MALEPEQIRAAMNRHIHPDKFVVMKAGDFAAAAGRVPARMARRSERLNELACDCPRCRADNRGPPRSPVKSGRKRLSYFASGVRRHIVHDGLTKLR